MPCCNRVLCCKGYSMLHVSLPVLVGAQTDKTHHRIIEISANAAVRLPSPMPADVSAALAPTRPEPFAPLQVTAAAPAAAPVAPPAALQLAAPALAAVPVALPAALPLAPPAALQVTAAAPAAVPLAAPAALQLAPPAALQLAAPAPVTVPLAPPAALQLAAPTPLRAAGVAVVAHCSQPEGMLDAHSLIHELQVRDAGNLCPVLSLNDIGPSRCLQGHSAAQLLPKPSTRPCCITCMCPANNAPMRCLFCM